MEREKVLKAIDELHYRPNQLAVSLVTNTSNTIGLILPDSTNPFFASLSHCIEELLRKHNIAVIVGNTNSDPDITRQYLQLFSDKRVDGIILAQLDFEDEQEDDEQPEAKDVHEDFVTWEATSEDEKDDETEGSEEPDSQESSEDTEEDSVENAEDQNNAIADALEKAAKDEDKFEEELAEAEKEQDEEEASIHID